MRVMKFGGTSVGDAERIVQSAKLAIKSESPVVVVTSAMSGATDELLALARLAQTGETKELRTRLRRLTQHHLDTAHGIVPDHSRAAPLVERLRKLLFELENLLQGISLLRELSPRSLDLIASFGERFAVLLLAEAIAEQGSKAEAIDARDIFRTDNRFGEAHVLHDESRELCRNGLLPLTRDRIPVVTGFIARTSDGVTTTLGRGGSDYTASLLGAYLGAEEIWIWTDVDGVMTADPSVVPEARVLESITYREAADMAYFGSKVLHPRTMVPAVENRIPIRILNSFYPESPGTLVTYESREAFQGVKTVTSIASLALVTVEGAGMQGVSGVGERVFSATAKAGISVLMISQASSEQNITFAVHEKDGLRAREYLQKEFEAELRQKRIERIDLMAPVGILAIIGEGMKGTPGISQKMFSALGRSRVNVLAIAQGSSELNLSVVVEQRNLKRAVGAVHTAFGLTKTTHVFLLGKGLIGKTLIRQLLEGREDLERLHGVTLRVVGVCGRDEWLFDPHGMGNERLERIAEGAELSALGGEKRGNNGELLDHLARQQRLDVVFVDVTAERTGPLHVQALEKGFHVVTANKKPLSGSMEQYRAIREAAARSGLQYQFETTFGAGLPVLHSLRELVATHDEIRRITGCFSGTLGFVCSELQKGRLFSEIVLEARKLGYTEPDPRDDLGGVDVARKALIIAREIGIDIEMEDIALESLVSPELEALESVDEFLHRLPEMDDAMREKVQNAEKDGNVLRYVAEITPSGVEVKLRAVEPLSPIGQLDGPDNILVYETRRYRHNPLVIRGPGAGAEVTAAGVFGDILKIARKS